METNRDVFNRIAPGWYNYRHHTIFRKELESLAQRWQSGRLLNAGCGHGPDFLPFKDSLELHGVDFSRAMLELARKYREKFSFKINLIEADIRCLPYRDDSFDWVIAVAAYHHIKEKSDRLKAFRELYQVLKPGGEAFITMWNKWQPRFWLKPRNVLVPWRSKDRTFYRYYYLYSYRELESLLRESGFTVLKSFPESRYNFPIKNFSRNVCLLVRKE